MINSSLPRSLIVINKLPKKVTEHKNWHCRTVKCDMHPLIERRIDEFPVKSGIRSSFNADLPSFADD